MGSFFNPSYLQFLLFFPILGLLLWYILNSKQLKIITILFFCFSLLSFTGYKFITDWFYEALATIVLACLFAIFLKLLKKEVYNIMFMMGVTLLVFILSFGTFFSKLYDSYEVKNTWKKDNYSVQYIRTSNFVGTWYHYELHHTPFLGLFDKKIANAKVIDSTTKCIINFDTLNIGFNTCTNEIIELK